MAAGSVVAGAVVTVVLGGTVVGEICGPVELEAGLVGVVPTVVDGWLLVRMVAL